MPFTRAMYAWWRLTHHTYTIHTVQFVVTPDHAAMLFRQAPLTLSGRQLDSTQDTSGNSTIQILLTLFLHV
jgi:hypothetical protein